MEFMLGYPTGVPLGGIGTGILEMRSDGRLGTVCCNNNWAVPMTDTPGIFFAIQLKNRDGEEEIRLLQSGGEGVWRGMDRVNYRAEFPFAKVTYASVNPVFTMDLTAFGSLIPHNYADSSIPGTRFEFCFRNSERSSISFKLYLSWEHLSGCGALQNGTKSFDRDGNRILTVEEEGYVGLLFLPGNGKKAPINSLGEYALLAEKCGQSKISCHCWNVLDGQEGFWKAIKKEFPARVPEGREGEYHPAGVLAIEITLGPGEHLILPVALSWYMPRHFAGGYAEMNEEMRLRLAPMHKEEKQEEALDEIINYGHFYENRFDSAKEVAEYLLKNGNRLKKGSGELAAFLSETDLPEWLVHKLINDDAPLACNSILTRDGTLATLEACRGMGGAVGTNDQRLISHAAYQLFYPKLNRTELGLFARIQADDGHIPHFCGNVHQSIGSSNVSYGDTLWPDLSCSFIVQCWRDYMCTGDKTFFLSMLPHIRRAYEWLKTADQDGDGVPEGGSTWDVEPHEGLFSYTGSVWLATLRVLEQIAQVQGNDGWKKEVGEWFTKAQKSVTALYQGGYFQKLYNPLTGKGSDEIFVGQAAGEWIVRLLGLESVLPENMVKSALYTIYRNNADTSRYTLAPIKVTKEGELVDRSCAEQAWPQYTMVFVDCLALYLGMEEGMQNLRHFDRVVTELIQTPCTTTLWHNAVTGLPNWGSIDRYMNTPAIWFVLNALTGFHPALHENAVVLNLEGYGFTIADTLPLTASAFWAKMTVKSKSAGRKSVRIVFEKVLLPAKLGKLRIKGCRKVTFFRWNGKEILFSQVQKDGGLVMRFEDIPFMPGDAIEFMTK